MLITDDVDEPRAEQELLALSRAGDASAFCRLLEPLQVRLLRQATALTNDLSAAEDLVSETRVRASALFHHADAALISLGVLYSVGWNETDDGGQAVSNPSLPENANKGDWVWKNGSRLE
jgi:hypothetical protein